MAGTEGVPVELASLLVRCLRRGGTGDSNSYRCTLQVIQTCLIILHVLEDGTHNQMIHDIPVGSDGYSHGTHHYLNDVCDDDDDVVHEIVDDENIYDSLNMYRKYTYKLTYQVRSHHNVDNDGVVYDGVFDVLHLHHDENAFDEVSFQH